MMLTSILGTNQESDANVFIEFLDEIISLNVHHAFGVPGHMLGEYMFHHATPNEAATTSQIQQEVVAYLSKIEAILSEQFQAAQPSSQLWNYILSCSRAVACLQVISSELNDLSNHVSEVSPGEAINSSQIASFIGITAAYECFSKLCGSIASVSEKHIYRHLARVSHQLRERFMLQHEELLELFETQLELIHTSLDQIMPASEFPCYSDCLTQQSKFISGLNRVCEFIDELCKLNTELRKLPIRLSALRRAWRQFPNDEIIPILDDSPRIAALLIVILQSEKYDVLALLMRNPNISLQQRKDLIEDLPESSTSFPVHIQFEQSLYLALQQMVTSYQELCHHQLKPLQEYGVLAPLSPFVGFFEVTQYADERLLSVTGHYYGQKFRDVDVVSQVLACDDHAVGSRGPVVRHGLKHFIGDFVCRASFSDTARCYTSDDFLARYLLSLTQKSVNHYLWHREYYITDHNILKNLPRFVYATDFTAHVLPNILLYGNNEIAHRQTVCYWMTASELTIENLMFRSRYYNELLSKIRWLQTVANESKANREPRWQALIEFCLTLQSQQCLKIVSAFKHRIAMFKFDAKAFSSESTSPEADLQVTSCALTMNELPAFDDSSMLSMIPSHFSAEQTALVRRYVHTQVAIQSGVPYDSKTDKEIMSTYPLAPKLLFSDAKTISGYLDNWHTQLLAQKEHHQDYEKSAASHYSKQFESFQELVRTQLQILRSYCDEVEIPPVSAMSIITMGITAAQLLQTAVRTYTLLDWCYEHRRIEAIPVIMGAGYDVFSSHGSTEERSFFDRLVLELSRFPSQAPHSKSLQALCKILINIKAHLSFVAARHYEARCFLFSLLGSAVIERFEQEICKYARRLAEMEQADSFWGSLSSSHYRLHREGYLNRLKGFVQCYEELLQAHRYHEFKVALIRLKRLIESSYQAQRLEPVYTSIVNANIGFFSPWPGLCDNGLGLLSAAKPLLQLTNEQYSAIIKSHFHFLLSVNQEDDEGAATGHVMQADGFLDGDGVQCQLGSIVDEETSNQVEETVTTSELDVLSL